MNKHLNVSEITGIFLIGFSYVVLSNTQYFEVQYSLLERGLFCLTMALIWRLLTSKQDYLLVPLPLLSLFAVMGLSVTQFLQAYIAEDFLGIFAVFIFAVIVSSTLDTRFIIHGIALGGLLISIWILFSLYLTPDTSWQETSKLVGPFTHWNSLGLSLVLTLPAIISFQARKTLLLRLSKISILLLFSAELYFSHSLTSLVTFALVLFIWTIVQIRKNNRLISSLLSATTALFIIICVINFEIILPIIGKTENLTGRTEIWKSVIAHFFDHALIGNGWSRLFPPDSPIFSQITSEAGFQAFHSHNDFLHWYVTTGVLGLIALTWTYLGVIDSIIPFQKWQHEDTSWIAFSLITLLITGITEISAFTTQGVLVLCLISIASWKNSNQKKLFWNIKIFTPM